MAVAPHPFSSIQRPLRPFLINHPAISLFIQGGLALGAIATAGPMLQRVMNQGYSSLLSSRVLSRLTGGYLLWEAATVIYQLSQSRIGFSERTLREYGIGASGHFQQGPSPVNFGSVGSRGFEIAPHLPQPEAPLYRSEEFSSAWKPQREGRAVPQPSYAEASSPAGTSGARVFRPHPTLTERQLLLKAPVLRFVVLPGLRNATSVVSAAVSAAKSFVPYAAKKGCRGVAITCLFVSTVSRNVGNFFNGLAGHPSV